MAFGQPQGKGEELRGELAKALAERKPRYHEFDAGSLVTIGDKPVGKVKVRLATKAEQDAALVAAHKYVKRITAEAPAAAEDSDILDDAKNAYILATVMRDAESPDAFPAVPHGEFLMQKTTTHEIAAMLNAYTEVVRREQHTLTDVTDAGIEQMALAIVELEDEGRDPQEALMRGSREFLAEAVISLSRFYVDAAEERDALKTSAAAPPAAPETA